MKICTSCNVGKPLSEFGKSKAEASGLTYNCYSCRRDYEKKWRNNNKDKTKSIRRKHELKKYGLTQEEFENLLTCQSGRCAICTTNDPNYNGWCVDHCHLTGKVRGILCHKCNIMLGFVSDNIATLKRAATYLEERGMNLS
jgi:Recombination endonuclease VII